MSGVLDVTSHEARDDLQAELGLSVFSAWAAGAWVGDDGASRFSASARRGNLDWITKQVNSRAGTPRYSDYYGHYSRELDAASFVDVGALMYRGDITFTSIEDESGERSQSEYSNVYAWTQYHRQYSPAVYGRTGLSAALIDRRRESRVLGADPDESTGFLDDDQDISVFRLDQLLEVGEAEDALLELGAGLVWQRADYDVAAAVERGDLGNLIGAQPSQAISIDERFDGLGAYLYGSWRWRLSDALMLEAGVRWDAQDFARGFEQQLSPRLTVRWDVTESHSVRASAGRFYQPEAINELQAADGIDRFQPPQWADHLVLGWEGRFGDHVGVRLEGYYKHVRDPKVRFENLFNPFVIAPELMPDRVRIDADEAKGQGVEFSVRYQRDDLHLWLNLATASVKDRVDGRSQPRAWNQDSTANAGVVWRRGPWELSAALTWHSGWQSTRLPAEVDDLDTALVLDRNAHELADYFTLDLKAQYTWTWPDQTLELYFELINSTDRGNIGGVEYEIDELDEGGYELIPVGQKLMPLVPAIGVVWRFR
jgi:outer membrane receptor protein involved in Fe transport